MSLWKVPDAETAELMIDFYQRILSGEARAEALRQAQLTLKRRHPDVFYWGAFIHLSAKVTPDRSPYGICNFDRFWCKRLEEVGVRRWQPR